MLSRICLFATPWTVACQASLSMGFSRQDYWSGLSFPPPGDLPDPGIEPMSPVSPASQADSLPSEPFSGGAVKFLQNSPSWGGGLRLKSANVGFGWSGFKTCLCHFPAGAPQAIRAKSVYQLAEVCDVLRARPGDPAVTAGLMLRAAASVRRGTGGPGFRCAQAVSWLPYFLAVRLLVSYSNALSLGFVICKMGMKQSPC